ncbi:hypothetical protein [Paenibacillus sp. GCM10028914]|uniref:hypothetical protein n=1 Tax=Paenibacillus sp. GCM10028914 TaxID=3273416 RepID=UPI0036129FAD
MYGVSGSNAAAAPKDALRKRSAAGSANNRSSKKAAITAPNVFGYCIRPPSLVPVALSAGSIVRNNPYGMSHNPYTVNRALPHRMIPVMCHMNRRNLPVSRSLLTIQAIRPTEPNNPQRTISFPVPSVESGPSIQ